MQKNSITLLSKSNVKTKYELLLSISKNNNSYYIFTDNKLDKKDETNLYLSKVNKKDSSNKLINVDETEESFLIKILEKLNKKKEEKNE